MIEKVTDPTKIVTDELVLRRLAEQGIDKGYVEFFRDYAPRSKGGSPYAKFYRDLKSGKKLMVASGLPMVDAYGFRHELIWQEKNGVIENGNNIFHCVIDKGSIRLIALSDQPTELKKDDEGSYHAQLFIGTSEVKPNSPTPIILEIDPINENYHDNMLLWQYDTVCRRRIRVIEGRFRERWLVDSNPHSRVEIKHNITGELRLKLSGARDANGELLKVKIIGDSEIIEALEFNKPGIVYPIEIGASATYYPDAHEEDNSVDGLVLRAGSSDTWSSFATGNGTDAGDDADVTYAYSCYSALAGDAWFNIYRGIILFNTAGLPDVAIISAAVLSLYGETKVNTTGASPVAQVYTSSPASDTALEAADYQTIDSTPQCDAGITYNNWKVADPFWNDFTFNATGRGNVSKTDVSKFGTRDSAYDVADSNPPHSAGAQQHYCRFYTADKGEGYKPKLVVTYQPLVPGASYKQFNLSGVQVYGHGFV